MRYDPILIASPVRSGTTMIAWLLHLHGAWIGKAGVTKAPETNPLVGTENSDIKRYLRSINPGDKPQSFEKSIEALVHTDGPWLLKTPGCLLHHELFIERFPDARWVLPKRDIESIVASAMRHPGFSKAGHDRRRQIAQAHINLQKQVAAKAERILWVDPNRLIEKDLTAAEELVQFCGFELDVDVYRNWIQPTRWHHA